MASTLGKDVLARLDALLRREYSRERDKSISNIVSAYAGAYEYIIDQLLKHKKPTTKKEVGKFMSDMATLQTDIYPVLENTYKRELKKMGGLGVQHTADWNTAALTLGGLAGLGMNQISKLSQIPDKTFEEQYNGYRFKDNTKLSQRIWAPRDHSVIMSVIQQQVSRGVPFSEIAQNLQKYSKTGNGYKNAFNLIYSESNYAYHNAQLEAAREFNDMNPYYEIVIEQYLSATHKVPDICDVYAGVYRLTDPIPMCPRHPGCNCGQRQLILGADDPRLLERINGTSNKIQAFQKSQLFEQSTGNVKFGVDLGVLDKLKSTQSKLAEMEPQDYKLQQEGGLELIDPLNAKEPMYHGTTRRGVYEDIMQQGFKTGKQLGRNEIDFVYFGDSQSAKYYSSTNGGQIIPADASKLKLLNVPYETWYGQKGKNNGIWQNQAKIKEIMGGYDGIKVVRDGVPTDYAVKPEAANKAAGYSNPLSLFLRGAKSDIDLLKENVVPTMKYGRTSGGLEQQSVNTYDAMFEIIERKYTGQQHNKMLQALVNVIPSNDAVGKQVAKLASSLYGIKPQATKQIPYKQFDNVVYR